LTVLITFLLLSYIVGYKLRTDSLILNEDDDDDEFSRSD